MRYGQLIMGPAGSGKSTYCSAMSKHGGPSRRTIHVVNLDPAAEHFDYEPIVDIRELIHVDDVMEDEELEMGPNGALVYAMEYAVENLDFLEDQLGDADDDYILFDCPGQIELYTHYPVMKTLVENLKRWNFNLCGVFLLDTQFLLEAGKFLSGTLAAMSTMVNLEIPAVNVLSKMDLLTEENKDKVDELLDSESRAAMLDAMDQSSNPWMKKYQSLSRAISDVLDDYSLVSFTTLDVTDEESVENALMAIDQSLSYGDDVEVKDRFPEEMDPDEERPGGNGLY